ncbi:MAG: HD-GYP domain-containing protein [Spirochaetes bacterium]|nr:HD-GYP domain-containing protein [Spirochaetota bacterium]
MEDSAKRLEVIVEFMVPGATLSGDTYDSENNFLYPAYTVYTAEVIEQLKSKGIKRIYYTPAANTDATEFTQKAKDIWEALFEAIRNNARPNLEQSKEFVLSLHSYVKQNKDRFLYLMKIKDFDDYTFTHSVNVGILAMAMASKHGLEERLVREIGLGAFLHDVGKLMIPVEILNKKEKLTDSEFELIKKHPEYGYEYVAKHDHIPPNALDVILHHHENYNGKGYPQSLQDEDIPIGAKITAICDVYDALITARPYKRAYSSREAILTIIKESRAKFNPVLVSRFVRDMTPILQKDPILPVGSLVLLTTGEVAQVQELHSTGDLRPIVKILTNDKQQKIARPFTVDLTMDSTRSVKRILPR